MLAHPFDYSVSKPASASVRRPHQRRATVHDTYDRYHTAPCPPVLACTQSHGRWLRTAPQKQRSECLFHIHLVPATMLSLLRRRLVSAHTARSLQASAARGGLRWQHAQAAEEVGREAAVTPLGPLALYLEGVRSGKFSPDPQQVRAVRLRLQRRRRC